MGNLQDYFPPYIGGAVASQAATDLLEKRIAALEAKAEPVAPPPPTIPLAAIVHCDYVKSTTSEIREPIYPHLHENSHEVRFSASLRTHPAFLSATIRTTKLDWLSDLSPGKSYRLLLEEIPEP